MRPNSPLLVPLQPVTDLPAFRVVGWEEHRRGHIAGFLALQLECGLVIHDVRVVISGDATRICFPGRPLLDAKGRISRDKVTGKHRFARVLSWPDRLTADRFGEAVLAALEAAYPGALDEC